MSDPAKEPHRVRVVREHQLGYAPSWSMAEFFAFATGLRDSVPAEFRDEASVELECDDGSAEFSVKYERPELPSERAARLEQAAAGRQRAEMAERRRFDLVKAEYERLQAKFEPSAPGNAPSASPTGEHAA